MQTETSSLDFGDTLRFEAKLSGADCVRLKMLEAELLEIVRQRAHTLFGIPREAPTKKACCGD